MPSPTPLLSLRPGATVTTPLKAAIRNPLVSPGTPLLTPQGMLNSPAWSAIAATKPSSGDNPTPPATLPKKRRAPSVPAYTYHHMTSVDQPLPLAAFPTKQPPLMDVHVPADPDDQSVLSCDHPEVPVQAAPPVPARSSASVASHRSSAS